MSKEFLNQNYYLICVLMLILAFVLFTVRYEKKKPQARELVTLAVMSAIAIASRAAFAAVPFLKPTLGIIMITGMAFGSGAGFLTGAVSAFVSNFLFGQGPWTPWQMAAYGIGGALAGFLYRHGIMREEKKIRTAIIGYVLIQAVVGPILDSCTIFTVGRTLTVSFVMAVLGAGLVPNAVHGLATGLTLFFLCKPMMEKLNRMKLKYGMIRN